MIRESLAGAYILTHVPTGKFYVGSSSNLGNRRAEHRLKLTKGTHKNPNLQAVFTCWEDMSWKSFPCDTREQAYDQEQQLLDRYLSSPDCCNIGNDAKSLWSKGSMPVHRRERLSELKTGNTNMLGKTHSEETRQKMREARIGIVVPTGRTCSVETREKISAARKGIAQRPKGFKHSEETKQLMSVVHKAISSTPESKAKARAAKAAKTKKVSINGVVYDGVKEAARQLEMWPGGVSTRCHSTDEKYKDWFFVDVTV